MSGGTLTKGQDNCCEFANRIPRASRLGSWGAGGRSRKEDPGVTETSVPSLAASAAGAPPDAVRRGRVSARVTKSTSVWSRMASTHVCRAMVFCDVAALAVAATLAAVVSEADPATLLLVAVLGFAALGGLPERPTLALSTLEQVPWLTRRMATAFLLGSPLILFRDSPSALTQAAFSVVLVVVGRAFTNVVLRRRRSRGIGLERTLMVGMSDPARRFMQQLASDQRFGLQFVGVVDDATSAHDDSPEADPVGQLADLPGLVEGLNIRRVIVGPEVPGGPQRAVALRRTLNTGARVHLVPRMSEVVPIDSPPFGELVLGHPLIELPRPMAGGIQCGVKRLVDVVVSSLLLVLLAPLLGVLAIGVRRSSPGPALFRQPRVGRNDREFLMYKFRTFPMDHVDVVQSLHHDACPLRFGRFLRRSSLDELPQLLNVLRGDMSLVGPRPERPHFVAPMIKRFPEYDDRHRVRGGMTGLAQTMGYVGDTPMEDRIRLDNRYIDSWSLWQDALIAVRTFAALVRKAWH